jgi:hypothetical protein
VDAVLPPWAAGMAHETNETIGDIRRKNSPARTTATNAEQTRAKRSSKMLKPSFRFFIIPLGAICTLASLSAQNATPRAQRDSGSFVHQQVVDCSNKNPADVCVISYDSETGAR